MPRGWIFGLLVGCAVPTGKFVGVAGGFLEDVVLLVTLDIFPKLLAFPMVLFGFGFANHFLIFFLMDPLHLQQGVVELPFKLGALLLKGGPHELALQLDLFCQILPVFINQSLLVPHHGLQLADLSLSFCLFCQEWLYHENIALQFFFSSNIQPFQFAVFPQKGSYLVPKFLIFLTVLFLNLSQFPSEVLILRLLLEVKREDGINLVIYLLQGKRADATLFGLFGREEGVRPQGA